MSKAKQTEEKEKRIAIAVKFLTNPDIANVAEDQVNKYLKGKGLTDEDIKQARDKAIKEIEAKKQKEAEKEKEKQQQLAAHIQVTAIQGQAISPDEFNQIIEAAKNSNFLSLRNRQVQAISPQIFQLQALQTLILSFNKIAVIPDEIAQLKQLKRFHAVGCNLADNQISKEFFNLHALEEVNLARNRLVYMDDFVKLTNLTILDLSHNEILVIPKGISTMTSLQLLALQSNNISRLPVELKVLDKLKRLYLMNNLIGRESFEKEKDPKVLFEEESAFE